MSKRDDSPAKKTPKMSFREEETVAYSHKAQFLDDLHKLEPEVEKALKGLLPYYKTLFDEHRQVDREALFYPPGFREFFSRFFTINSGEQTNSERGLDDCARRYLANHNRLLKAVLEFKTSRGDAIENAVRSALNDPGTGDEIHKIPGVEEGLTRGFLQLINEGDGFHTLSVQLEDLLSQSLNHFRRTFFDGLINKFHLQKEWLCLSAFLAIQEGNPKLEMPHNQTMHSYPKELLREVYGEEENSAVVHFFPRGLPLHESFQFDKPFSVYDTAEEYEEQAIIAYREQLRNYVTKMQQALRSHGYKLKRRRHDYARIEWLVRWTVQGWTVSQIVSHYNVVEATVWKALKTFEKYDLPVRRKRADES